MAWFGKVLGSTFGFFIGGPLGAALGAVLGHQVDRNLGDASLLEADPTSDSQQRMQMAFFTATFTVMGHLAKADGRVTEEEIATAREIMGRLGLSADMRKTAISLFNDGKQTDFPLDATLEQFRSECHTRYPLFRMFLQCQMEEALADGPLNQAEERLLLYFCERLRFPRFEYHTLRARMEAEQRFARSGRRHQWGRRDIPDSRALTLAEAYRLLGVDADTAEPEIKRAYRKLISQHHPDKLQAKGLPDSAVRAATEKTQQIRKAYEAIAKARKF